MFIDEGNHLLKFLIVAHGGTLQGNLIPEHAEHV